MDCYTSLTEEYSSCAAFSAYYGNFPGKVAAADLVRMRANCLTAIGIEPVCKMCRNPLYEVSAIEVMTYLADDSLYEPIGIYRNPNPWS